MLRYVTFLGVLVAAMAVDTGLQTSGEANARVRPPAVIEVDQTLKADKLAVREPAKEVRVATIDPRLDLSEKRDVVWPDASTVKLVAAKSPEPPVDSFTELVTRDYTKPVAWPVVEIVRQPRAKQRRVQKVYVSRQTPVAYVAQPSVSISQDMMGKVVISIAQQGIAYAAGPFAPIPNFVFCMARNLNDMEQDDKRKGAYWTAEDRATNTGIVVPYCLPVIGGFMRAKEATNPLEALTAMLSSILDINGFASFIPNALNTPLSVVTQIGPHVQDLVPGAPRTQPATRQAQVQKTKKKVASK